MDAGHNDGAPPGDRVSRTAAKMFLQVEHGAYIVLGVVLTITALIALVSAAALLWQGALDFTDSTTIIEIIDRILFVLMLVEILHTVQASLRSGTLNSEPFLIVGLIASIRRVLVITLKSSEAAKGQAWSAEQERVFQVSMIELVVLGGLILIMVISIYLLKSRRVRGTSDE